MRTTQLSRIKDTFLEAMDRPDDEREDFVRAECADDPLVLAEVLRLVRVRQRNTGTLRPLRVARPEAGVAEGGPVTLAAPDPSSIAPAPESGDVVLGRYELREAIGAGAFGTVFRAFDRVTKEMVAVKTVALTSRRAEEWHVREVATLRRARVPGVVELLATGNVDGWAVVVMSLVEGTPFPGDDVRVGDAEKILPRAVSLLESVGRLHAAGVYHRDLKPANVLVSRQGHVTLVDFGIAQDETDALRWIEDETVAGTLPYLAPERLRGERATAATELYAIGVIVIEALTGETPDGALRSRAELDGLGRYADAVRTLLADCTTEPVRRVLASLVAEDPRDRPVDTWAALEALRDVLGPMHALELPWLGDDAPIRAVVEAAEQGRSLDVVGPRGSGRTRVLKEAERRLLDAGFFVQWVRPARAADAPRADDRRLDRELAALGPSPDELDREHRESLRHRVSDGLVLLVDDAASLDAPVLDLVDSLRSAGTVVRVVAESDGASVRIEPLRVEDLRAAVRGPERLFQIPPEVAKVLWQRTRGRAREVTREVRSWIATGLARWDGGLVVSPRELDRLRAAGGLPAAGSDIASALAPGVSEVWAALSVVGEPISVAALADVVQRPRRVVRSELGVLVAHGLADLDREDGPVDLVRSSPDLAAIPLATRRAWSERVAAHLGTRSPSRFRHLVAVERYESACRAALDAAGAALDGGDVAESIAILDPALAIARRHAPGDSDLYAELLATICRAAVKRADRSAVGLALYHASLAPDRGERVVAWAALMAAAESCLASDVRRALAQIDDIPSLPTEAHRHLAHIIANFAARGTRSLELQGARVMDTAAWVRRSPGREARASLSASTGWIRYEQGRYGVARRLHERAARLTRDGRGRRTSICNAAMAALEDHDLESAERLADDALRAARRGGDAVNAARAELVLRQCAYRSGLAEGVDDELLAAADLLDPGGTRGMIRLTEAAVAFRRRRLTRAGPLAELAADDLRAAGFRTAALLADALALACGGHCSPELLTSVDADEGDVEPVGVFAQAAALVASAPGAPRLGSVTVRRGREWARSAPRADGPREVLSPREVSARLGTDGMPGRSTQSTRREEGRT